MKIERTVSMRRYTPQDEDALFALMVREGDGWKGYWDTEGKPKYQKALNSSVTFLMFKDEELCGFIRCRDDDGLGIYVYDLLVDRACRGREYGRLLMEYACGEFPGQEAYVMSGVDGYYEKLGYKKAGTIFAVPQ